VDDAGLHRRQRPRGVDRLRQALEAVADDDADVLGAAVLDLGEDTEPELRSLTAVAGPDPEDVPLPVHRDAHGDIERLVPHLAVADFHHQGVDEHDRIDAIQWSVLPFGHLLDDLVGDPADRVLGHGRAIDVVEVRGDLSGRQPTRGEREHDLVDPGESSLTFLDDLRLERPRPVPGHVDLDGTDLGQHGLGAAAVADVAALSLLVLLVTEVFGQLCLERCLQDSLGESVQQPVGADEVDALFLRLLQQLLRELLLIDDLSRHRIDHLGRVHHGLFLSVRPTQKHRKSDSPSEGHGAIS